MRRFIGRQSVLLLLLSLAIAASLVLLPACQHSSTDLSLPQEASAHRFCLTAWHVQHVPVKLTQTAVFLAMPPCTQDSTVIEDFVELRDELGRLEVELGRELALHGVHSAEVATIKGEIEGVRSRYRALAPKAEALIGHQITQVLTSEGLGLGFAHWDLVFPPVVFVFQSPPYLLVLSPRDRVDRLDDLLLSPDMNMEEVEALENALLQDHDLSALVVGLGGIATYPSIVSQGMDLYHSVFLAAHEWSHQYLFFHPLGIRYARGGVMREVNEAVADIVAREVADRICGPPGADPLSGGGSAPQGEERFEFQTEMHRTRVTLDSLLAEGMIEAAEQYLEERRQTFANHGYHIRKLNQAYFAFHGTYAFSPASVSPVGEQLEELRRYCSSLGEFIHMVRDLSSYEQLLDHLSEMRSNR